jgi:hypothetical protein
MAFAQSAAAVKFVQAAKVAGLPSCNCTCCISLSALAPPVVLA